MSSGKLPEEWKEEYRELNEDYRFFSNIGWQSTLAVIAVDGLLLSPAYAFFENRFFLGTSALFFITGIITIIIGISNWKWRDRNYKRAKRLQFFERAKGFGRFAQDEKGFVKIKVASFYTVFILTIGAVIIGTATLFFLVSL
jgi:hypothetical protein